MTSNAQNFLQSINWSNPSWDLMIALVFIVGSFLYGFSLGRDRLIVIMVSIYMALALISNAPYLDVMMKNRRGLESNFRFQAHRILGNFSGAFLFLSVPLCKKHSIRDEKGAGGR